MRVRRFLSIVICFIKMVRPSSYCSRSHRSLSLRLATSLSNFPIREIVIPLGCNLIHCKETADKHAPLSPV